MRSGRACAICILSAIACPLGLAIAGDTHADAATVKGTETPYEPVVGGSLRIDEAPLQSLAGEALFEGGGTEYVDGVSDQSPPQWSDPPGETDGMDMGGHVMMARYVVQWNVMSGDYPTYRTELEDWYADVLARGLTVELSLASYDGVMPASVNEYREMLEALLDAFPAVRYVEAWDEPNNTPGLSAASAARYTNVAHALCATRGCTVIAGNLLDSNPNMVEYERSYEQGLDPVERDWGIHPYYAVAARDPRTVLEFKANLPGEGAGESVWFTEVGAYECEDLGGVERVFGQRSQAVGASWLVNRLMPLIKPAHVFYYELTYRAGEQPPCDRSDSDTAVYVPSGDPRAPYLAREAASYIADDGITPAATAAGATG
jgi:hypothetical protein